MFVKTIVPWDIIKDMKNICVYMCCKFVFAWVSLYAIVCTGCTASKGDESCWEALQTGRYRVMLGDKV